MKKIIIKLIIALCSYCSIAIGVKFLETQSMVLANFHSYLKLKEINDGMIANTYISVAITVISLSAIAFTIIIGMMQYLVNEISYQSYDKRVLKDKKIRQIFLMLMIMSILLILVYLIADIPQYPLMYLTILIMLLITVIGLVYYLFILLFKDLSLYSLMENNHKALVEAMEQFDKHTVTINELQEKLNRADWKFFNSTYVKFIQYRIKKIIKEMEILKEQYISDTVSATEELTLLVRNACRRSDSHFAKSSLEYVTKLIVHRFKTLDSNKKQHPLALSMMGIYEEYDRFIERSLVPIYSVQDSGNATNEIIRIANEELASAIIQGEILRFTDGVGYNLTFNIVFSYYKENIMKQLTNKYIGVTIDYSNAMNNLINKFDVANSKHLFLDISQNNVLLAEGVFKNIEPVNYIHLIDVQSNLVSKAILLADKYMLEKVLSDLFSMFRISIVNVKLIKTPLSLQRINSYWLDTLKQSSLPVKLVFIYNKYFCENIENKEYQRKMHIILSTIISSFKNQMHLIAASSLIDHMIILAFCELVQKINDIIAIYIRFDIEDFNILYKDNLRLYTQFVSMYKVEDKFGYYQVFDSIEETLSKSIHDEKLKQSAIDEYIRFTKVVQKNIATDEYSSRCFDNLIWLPLILNDENLYQQVLNVINSELDDKKITILINDLEREIYSMGNHFSSHSLSSLESLKQYCPEKLEELKQKLSNLIDKKENTTVSETEIIQTEES